MCLCSRSLARASISDFGTVTCRIRPITDRIRTNVSSISFIFCFLIFCHFTRPCFVFRHPTAMVRNVFLQPFSEYVWYCIVLSGCLIICIAATISYREMGNYHCYQRPGKWCFDGNELCLVAAAVKTVLLWCCVHYNNRTTDHYSNAYKSIFGFTTPTFI